MGRARRGVVTKTVTWGVRGGKEIATNGDKGGRGVKIPGFYGDMIVEWRLMLHDEMLLMIFVHLIPANVTHRTR